MNSHTISTSSYSSQTTIRASSETLPVKSPEKPFKEHQLRRHSSLDWTDSSTEIEEDELKDDASIKTKTSDVPYCIFSKQKKWSIVIMAAVATFISPLTANIFLPAMNSMQEVGYL